MKIPATKESMAALKSGDKVQERRKFRDISKEEIAKYLSYDPETGSFQRLMDRGGAKKGRMKLYLNNWGYFTICINHVNYLAHRIAWALYYGEMPNISIDHINRIKTDNRICNLRLADCSQNAVNRGLTINNTSGHKGVTFNRRKGKWQAQIAWRKKKRKVIGYYDDIEEAKKAYNQKAEELFGEYNYGGLR